VCLVYDLSNQCNKDIEIKIEDHPILKQYNDIFLEEVPGLPPRREFNFSIKSILGFVLVSNSSYHMSTKVDG